MAAASRADARCRTYQVHVHLRRRLLELHFPIHGTCVARPVMDCGARPRGSAAPPTERGEPSGWLGIVRTHGHTVPTSTRLRFVHCTPPRRREFVSREEDGDRVREKERERRHLSPAVLHATTPSHVRRATARVATPRDQPKCQKRATAHAHARPAPSSYVRPDAMPIARADPIRPDAIRLDPRESFTARSIETGMVS